MTDKEIIEKLKYLKTQVDGIKNNNSDENIIQKGTHKISDTQLKLMFAGSCILIPIIIYYSLLNVEADFIMYEIKEDNSYFMKREVSYFLLYLYTSIISIIICMILYFIIFLNN